MITVVPAPNGSDVVNTTLIRLPTCAGLVSEDSWMSKISGGVLSIVTVELSVVAETASAAELVEKSV